VLDWQHPPYWFWLHAWDDAVDLLDWDQWKAPVLPAGDYGIFLAEDDEFGLGPAQK